jgi:hypothetical protein
MSLPILAQVPPFKGLETVAFGVSKIISDVRSD